MWRPLVNHSTQRSPSVFAHIVIMRNFDAKQPTNAKYVLQNSAVANWTRVCV